MNSWYLVATIINVGVLLLTVIIYEYRFKMLSKSMNAQIQLNDLFLQISESLALKVEEKK